MCVLSTANYIHVPSSTRRDSVRVIASVFPGNRAIRGNFDEFELQPLYLRAKTHSGTVWINRIEHWTYCGIKSRSPVAQLMVLPVERCIHRYLSKQHYSL